MEDKIVLNIIVNNINLKIKKIQDKEIKVRN